MIEFLWLAVPCLAAVGFLVGRQRALLLAESLAGGRSSGDLSGLHSLPNHYGQYVLLWAALPAVLVLFFWFFAGDALVEAWSLSELRSSGLLGDEVAAEEVLECVREGIPAPVSDAPDASGMTPEMFMTRALARGETMVSAATLALAAILGAIGITVGRSRVNPELRARNRVEQALQIVLMLCSAVAILTTVGIVLSLFFEAMRFFRVVSPAEFFFSTEWSPQTAMRADQVASSGAFGAVPIFAGTLLITSIAMFIALPVGLMSAIYLAFYASDRARSWVKPLLEVIAGIPTVVWGSFAALSLAPWIRTTGEQLGLQVALESALAAGLAMGVMIIPFVSSLSDDALNAVPRTLRDGSLAIGATPSETIRKVMLPAALPGIVGAFLLAVSRAVGETMIVVMAAGLAANLTLNPFEAVTTVTVQIVSLLTGDQEFDSAKTLAAFALGLTLFFVTLGLNLIALATVRRFREEYE